MWAHAMGQTAEQQRAKRAAAAEEQGRTLRSYRRRTDTPSRSSVASSSSCANSTDSAADHRPAPTLPGGFNVGDRLIYTGNCKTFAVDGQPAVIVREGERCEVTSPAQAPSDSGTVSVRFHHLSQSLGARTFSVGVSLLRYCGPSDRMCYQVEELIAAPWPSNDYVCERLRLLGCVDGSRLVTNNEDSLQRVIGRLRRYSI